MTETKKTIESSLSDYEGHHIEEVSSSRILFRRPNTGILFVEIMFAPTSGFLIVTGDGPDFIFRCGEKHIGPAIEWACRHSGSPTYMSSKVICGDKVRFDYEAFETNVWIHYAGVLVERGNEHPEPEEIKAAMPEEVRDLIDDIGMYSEHEIYDIMTSAEFDYEQIAGFGEVFTDSFIQCMAMFQVMFKQLHFHDFPVSSKRTMSWRIGHPERMPCRCLATGPRVWCDEKDDDTKPRYLLAFQPRRTLADGVKRERWWRLWDRKDGKWLTESLGHDREEAVLAAEEIIRGLEA